MKILTILIMSLLGTIGNAATSSQCAQVQSEFHDAFSLPNSPIYQVDVKSSAANGCYVEVVFFGNKGLLDYVQYRFNLGLSADKEVMDDGAIVPIRVLTPTPMDIIVEGEDTNPTLLECQQVQKQFLSIVGLVDAKVEKSIGISPSGASVETCRVSLVFADNSAYLSFLKNRYQQVDEFLIDKEKLVRTPSQADIYVPLWFSLRY